MEKETVLSKDIQAAGDMAKYDAAVKCLLADKKILAWLLKSCVEEFREEDIIKIADTYIEGEPQISQIPVMPDETNTASKVRGTGVEDVTISEGMVIFDIRFEAVLPGNGEMISLIINVEAQNEFYPGYPLIKRGIYYCSRMISSQYGTVFTKSHYEKVKKVYSIWICTNPPKKRENTITEYSLTEKSHAGHVQEKRENYDLLTVIMICLGHEENRDETGILRLFRVLLSSELKPKEKREILEQDFQIPMTETLERQVEDVCNLSEGVWEKGMEKGMEKGIEKGMEKGYEIAELSAIKNLMHRLKMTAEQAMDTLDIAVDKREKYNSMIHQ